MSKNFKKFFYLNLKHKFEKNSWITQPHFDVLRMLIAHFCKAKAWSA